MFPPVPPPRLRQLENFGTLEYAVFSGELSPKQALSRAEKLDLDADLVEDLRRSPWLQTGTREPHVATRPCWSPLNLNLQSSSSARPCKLPPSLDTPLNTRVRRVRFSEALRPAHLTRGEAEKLVADWAEKLGVAIHIDWARSDIRVEVDLSRTRAITIPGGFVRHASIDADALAVAVGHEYGHLANDSRHEALADYYGTLVGLRVLWNATGAADEDEFFERAVLASYRILLLLGRDTGQELNLLAADDEPYRMNESGYPSLQSRWILMRAGIAGLPPPRRARQAWERSRQSSRQG